MFPLLVDYWIALIRLKLVILNNERIKILVIGKRILELKAIATLNAHVFAFVSGNLSSAETAKILTDVDQFQPTFPVFFWRDKLIWVSIAGPIPLP